MSVGVSSVVVMCECRGVSGVVVMCECRGVSGVVVTCEGGMEQYDSGVKLL